MFQRILVAWDGSDVARHALDVRIELARRYDAAGSVAYSPAHAETEADRAGVPLTHEGDHPAEDLLRYAHEHGFDPLVVSERNGNRARIGARA